MAGCIAHARNGHISTAGRKSDVAVVFLDPDFLSDAEISAIWPYIRAILHILKSHQSKHLNIKATEMSDNFSFSIAGTATSAPHADALAEFEGYFKAGKHRGKGKEGREKTCPK